MKKFIIVIAALCGISSYGATFALSTNDAINVPTWGGKSNAVVLGKNGDVKVGGTLTAAGAVAITGIPTLAATQVVFSAAAIANTNAAVPLQGISVRVNGTNYVLKLYPIVGP